VVAICSPHFRSKLSSLIEHAAAVPQSVDEMDPAGSAGFDDMLAQVMARFSSGVSRGGWPGVPAGLVHRSPGRIRANQANYG
jgi:hypothetical protein